MLMLRINLGLFFSLFICSGAMQAQGKLYKNEFPLSDVKLLEGPLKHARDLNIEVLLQYDVDRLLAPYRKEAGLSEKAPSYPCWDGLDGHIAGHYLSAMAINYAATGNKECKKRMDYMLAELSECLKANETNNADWGVGYIGGFPNSVALWSTFKEGNFKSYKSAWAPFYNLHKMYAGLRDAWIYGRNENAKSMFLKFCDWGIDITSGLDEAQMQEALNMEHGGMNEIFADAYQITGNKKYLEAAKKYSHNLFLDPLSKGIDNLDNWHANTQIPKFIGFTRIAELSGDSIYENAGRFSWETIVNNRTLAFGGNSRREHFPSVLSCSDYVNDVDGPETCNTYNMLKLTEDLFRMNPSVHYVDYYERALFNHILSTQHPEHGGYVYFTSARPRHYRVYSTPNNAMWCCVGTGMENQSKYNQFIYSHSGDSLFLNLFVASELNWKDKKVQLRQETSFPYEEGTTLKVTKGSAKFKLMLRYPEWVKAGALKVTLNGNKIQFDASPATYVVVEREWKKGDVLKIDFPMSSRIVRLPHVDNYIAFMHGPILLGAKTGQDDLRGLLADDGRWAQYPSGKLLPVDQAPILIDDDIHNMGDKLIPVSGNPLHFKLDVKMENPMDVILEPFANIHDSRYMIYWLALTNRGFKSYKDSLTSIEKEKIEIEQRTIDFVAPGEQQPEMDHFMEEEYSNSGNTNNEFYRAADRDGHFSYSMKTNSETNLSLLVRYWGAEWGSRKFEIYIDDKKLVTEDNTGRWNQSQFFNIEYQIPDSMVDGKNQVRVRFQSLPGNTAGAVYYVRLLRNRDTIVNPEKVFNPIIQTKFTADPAPMVYDGTVYLYTSHDEDTTVDNFFTMYDWCCYSSKDMVNWTDHGVVASLKNFTWTDKTSGAWAPQCIERNGKFYLYVPIHGEGISVLVSDSPTGPFIDPLGKRLIDSEHIWQDIDPTVAIDSNGQAWLYWGNPNLWYVKLNEDMISYDRSVGKDGIVSIEMTADAFGFKEGRDGKPGTTYTEGPWFYKRNNRYYMIYAAEGIPEYISYSMAHSPEGPWTYKGQIMKRADHLAFTNHAGVIDFKDKSYIFYHDQSLSRGEGFKRSVCVEEFSYNDDGTIPLITPTKESVLQSADYLDPFQRVEAETIAWSEGVKTAGDSQIGVYVTNIENGDYLKVRSIDFGDGANTLEVGVSSASQGGTIEVRLDHPNGELLGSASVKNTGSWQNWKTVKASIKKVKGVHDVCFVFKGKEGELFNFDWWKFSK